MSDGQVPHEVVIVRRRGGDGDEGHHGGAWKIAFADLMTAMMAFFLVMWLLNVSDKEKIQQIATYFNPMKLNSKIPTRKGVQEEKDAAMSSPMTEGPTDKGATVSDVEGKDTQHGGHKRGGDGVLEDGDPQKAEEELFNDPYGVLARLAQEASQGDTDQATQGQSESMARGGEGFSNPFEPFADRQVVPETGERAPLTLDEPGLQPDPADAADAMAKARASAAEEAVAEEARKAVSALKSELGQELAGISPEKRPSIDVEKVADGFLISLTDDFRFGMFESASAEPRPETVVVMEKIAKVLAEREGRIVVRGHTDARPFRSERNNNWRLSMSRAKVAYYMLARGGVDESRFESIEGRADRDLKVESDPNAAENRRIEILIRDDRP
ncbi:MAG TPA: flagellar motor protein MotB [Hyphomicrobium sp.]|nr:flagellar motor protein MotB [Hyphomicrobium sp.]